MATSAVEYLRASYPTIPIYALASNVLEAAELEAAGADHTVIGATAAGLDLGSELLSNMGASMAELQAMELMISMAMKQK